MDWVSVTVAALSGGGLVGTAVNTYYKNRISKADQKRSDENEAKKAIIELLPELSQAENSYRLYLNESIYLHDLEGEIRSQNLSTIVSIGASEGLVEKLKSVPFHLLKSKAVAVLSHHASNFINLNQELLSMQTPQNYEHDDPGRVALNAKIIMEKRLADIILELHVTRRELTFEYVGRSAWSKSNRAHFSELRLLRRRAYNVKSLHDRWSELRNWSAIHHVRLRSRFKRWQRERKIER